MYCSCTTQIRNPFPQSPYPHVQCSVATCVCATVSDSTDTIRKTSLSSQKARRSRTVLLTQEQFYPPNDGWQCLMFWVVTTRGLLLVSRG